MDLDAHHHLDLGPGPLMGHGDGLDVMLPDICEDISSRSHSPATLSLMDDPHLAPVGPVDYQGALGAALPVHSGLPWPAPESAHHVQAQHEPSFMHTTFQDMNPLMHTMPSPVRAPIHAPAGPQAPELQPLSELSVSAPKAIDSQSEASDAPSTSTIATATATAAAATAAIPGRGKKSSVSSSASTDTPASKKKGSVSTAATSRRGQKRKGIGQGPSASAAGSTRKSSGKSTRSSAAPASKSAAAKADEHLTDDSDSSSNSLSKGSTKHAGAATEKDSKRQQRLMRNRVSAQQSRERKKQYLVTLETEVEELRETNRDLVQRLEQLASENASLRARMDAMDVHRWGDSSSSMGSGTPGVASPVDIDGLDSTSGSEVGSSSPYWVDPESDVLVAPGGNANKRFKGAKRTGMILFALVFSFGVFYNIAGIDMDSLGVNRPVELASDEIDTPLFKGRVLTAIRAVDGQAAAAAAAEAAAASASKSTGRASVAPRRSSRLQQGASKTEVASSSSSSSSISSHSALANSQLIKRLSSSGAGDDGEMRIVSLLSDDDESVDTDMYLSGDGDDTDDANARDKKKVHLLDAPRLAALTRQLQEKMRGMGFNATSLPSPPASSASGRNSRSVVKPIVVKSDEMDEAANSMAVDVYRQNQDSIHANLAQALDLYKKMLAQTNTSSSFDTSKAPMSIMFCPAAIHIQPSMFGTKAAASPSNAGATTSKHLSTIAPANVDMENMLLWVPSHSLATNFHNTYLGSSAGHGDVGLTELRVKVDGARSVHA